MKNMKKLEMAQIKETYFSEKILLSNFRKDAAVKKIPIIDETVGRFLEGACLIKNPENILEIGCGSGYSSYFLVKGLENGSYTAIDLNGERLKSAEIFVKSKFPDKNCAFLQGNAINLIPSLKLRYDLVFIDAAKYEYTAYIKQLMSKIKKGSIIIADNIFYKDKIFSTVVTKHDYRSVMGIRDYINFVTGSSHFKTIFLDVGDGLSVSTFLGN
jgi:predicted O-methyltransferase YrrM